MSRFAVAVSAVVSAALSLATLSRADDLGARPEDNAIVKELPWKRPRAQAAVAAVPVPSDPSLETFVMSAAYQDCEVSKDTLFSGPRDIAGYEPKAGGKYPVFIFLAGTLMRFNGPEAKLITSEMAKRGFVAAAVDYDSFTYPFCAGMEAKAKCIFDANAETSALSKVCSRGKADCDLGVVVSGFSQGANLASRAANESDQIRAAYLLGHGDRAMVKSNVSRCMVDSATKLTPSQMRSVNGESDAIFGRNADGVRRQLHRVVGTEDCKDTTSCELENGAGWHLVPDSGLKDGKADHCYFFHDANIFCSVFDGFDPAWESGSEPWSLGPNLDWLAAQVKQPSSDP